ncbi:hemagglutinin repeat-containing protein [Fusobacterium nucleatum]
MAGVNLGFNKSSSKTNAHNESVVVATIKGKDENSSIAYNNVKNIEYVGTQAKDTKFIYNNVDNITKKAVELNNSYSSSSKSSGVSVGVTINYNNGFQAEADTINISASKSNIMNSNGTGLFVNVDEVHNNTKNMTLSGFNQIGGKVTGNIQNLTIESKQNTSNTTRNTKGGSLSLSPNSNVISGVGINYANKDLESVTRNTVIGNVEIGKTSGDEINKDLDTMTEVTKDEDTNSKNI